MAGYNLNGLKAAEAEEEQKKRLREQMLRQDTFAFARNFLPHTDRYGRTTGVDAAGLGGLLAGRLLGDALYRWFNREKPIYDNNGNNGQNVIDYGNDLPGPEENVVYDRTGETVASENRQNGGRTWYDKTGVPAKSNIGTEPEYGYWGNNDPAPDETDAATAIKEKAFADWNNKQQTAANRYTRGLLGQGVLNKTSDYPNFINNVREQTLTSGYTAKNTGVNPGAGVVNRVTDYRFKPEDYYLY